MWKIIFLVYMSIKNKQTNQNKARDILKQTTKKTRFLLCFVVELLP